MVRRIEPRRNPRPEWLASSQIEVPTTHPKLASFDSTSIEAGKPSCLSLSEYRWYSIISVWNFGLSDEATCD